MAETTTDRTEMTRAEAASFLQSIADELESGRGKVSIPVGNKNVQLSPPDSIDSETTVTERARRLREDVEEVSIEFQWNPTKDTAESGAESESESESGSSSGVGASDDGSETVSETEADR